MSEPSYRLVYYSRNRLPGAPAAQAAEIEQILATSRRNNAPVDVTGALMFNDNYFAQALEGPRAAIEVIFERIQQDPRHGDVSLLSFEQAPRAFANWSMAFVGNAEPENGRFAQIGPESGFDPSRLTGHRLFEILRALLLEAPSDA